MPLYLLYNSHDLFSSFVNTNMLNKDAKSTAQGYVVFCSKDSVEEALKLNNMLLEGLRLRVDHATPTPDALRSIFVGNLPYQAEEMSLQQHFVKECGFQEIDVEGVRIIRDKDTMLCKGFGYVIFREKSMVAVALNKMHESTYMKRQLRVTVCGKRFKGRRGDDKAEDSTKCRSFEGKRSVVVAPGAIKRFWARRHQLKRIR
jgi:RNA recognition motif-containing protein